MHDRKGQKQSSILILSAVRLVVGVLVLSLSNSERPALLSVTLAAERSQDGEPVTLSAFEDFAQGQAHVDEKKYEEAIKAFNQAESKGVTLYELYLSRGYAYHEIGQFQKAKRDAETAIELQPTKSRGYELLAGVHYAMGHAEDTITVATNGLAKVEGIEKAKLQRERGILLMMLGRAEDAITDLTRAEELGEKTATLYYNRGRAYSMLGRYELALPDFSKVLSIAPEHTKALRARGWIYDCVGEYARRGWPT